MPMAHANGDAKESNPLDSLANNSYGVRTNIPEKCHNSRNGTNLNLPEPNATFHKPTEKCVGNRTLS